MGFSHLLGQDPAKRVLEHALSGGAVHHAYRFEGPRGVGKTTAAMAFAAALLCPEDPLGCGKCSSCARASTLSPTAPEVPAHPDLLFVGRGLYPQNLISASEANGISVEQVRRIIQPRMGFPPHEGKALVVLIFDADELTVSAANALLKTLEEPPPSTHFVLMTSRPARLLDTIVSRTLRVRFGPLPEAAIATLLAREGHSEALAARSSGSLERARALAEPERRARGQSFVDHALSAIASPHESAAIAFAEERPESRDELLELLLDLAQELASRARSFGGDSLAFAEQYREVTSAMNQIERNGSPALVLEAMVLSMRRLHPVALSTS